MLVFVHIPKTAGTTFHKILTHQVAASKILILHDTEVDLSRGLPDKLQDPSRRPELVMGHLSVGLHEWLPDVSYLTCLRHPVARIVSHYHHARNDPTHYLHDAIVSRGLDIAAYAASGLSGELSDGMTRMLAGVRDFHDARPDQSTLELAKANLSQRFAGWIISEKFDESLLQIATELGWKTPYYLRRKVGRYAGGRPLDASARTAIEEHNRLDLELYDWACAHLDRSINPQFPSPCRLNRFRRRNAVFGRAVFLAREARNRLCRLVSRPGPAGRPG